MRGEKGYLYPLRQIQFLFAHFDDAKVEGHLCGTTLWGSSSLLRPYPNVWSAAVLQAKNEEWQLVCANVFGLQWSH